MTKQATDPAIIKLPAVRLSFPHLFQAHSMEEGQEKKFSATFLLDDKEHGKLLDQIETTIKRLALDEFKKATSFKSCLRDGNEKLELEGYGDGKWFIPAARKTRPTVVRVAVALDGGIDYPPVSEDEGLIYAGCYVNATVRLWVQNNKWGKRVNAELRVVQFLRDGDSFGAGKVDVESDLQGFATDSGDGGSRRSGRGGKAAPGMEDF